LSRIVKDIPASRLILNSQRYSDSRLIWNSQTYYC